MKVFQVSLESNDEMQSRTAMGMNYYIVAESFEEVLKECRRLEMKITNIAVCGNAILVLPGPTAIGK